MSRLELTVICLGIIAGIVAVLLLAGRLRQIELNQQRILAALRSLLERSAATLPALGSMTDEERQAYIAAWPPPAALGSRIRIVTEDEISGIKAALDDPIPPRH